MDKFDNATARLLLDQLRGQGYPLEVTEHQVEALYDCIRRIMGAVPEDDRIFIKADYDDAVTALLHPTAQY